MENAKTGILDSYKWDKVKKEYASIVIESLLKHLPSIKSAHDFGCGTGIYIEELLKHKVKVTGFDLSPNAFYEAKTNMDNIHQIDVSGQIPEDFKMRDLSLAIEVSEHIPPQRVQLFIENLCNLSSKYIFMTSTNKPGKYHLNPQPKKYWIKKIEDIGTHYHSPTLSNELMEIYKKSIPDKHGLLWFKYDLMIFIRNLRV